MTENSLSVKSTIILFDFAFLAVGKVKFRLKDSKFHKEQQKYANRSVTARPCLVIVWRRLVVKIVLGDAH